MMSSSAREAGRRTSKILDRGKWTPDVRTPPGRPRGRWTSGVFDLQASSNLDTPRPTAIAAAAVRHPASEVAGDEYSSSKGGAR